MTDIKGNQKSNDEKGFRNWLKRNKDKVVIGITALASLAAIVLLKKNGDKVENIFLSNGVKKKVVYKTIRTIGNSSNTTVNSAIGDITGKLPVTESTVTTVSETVVEKTTSLLNDGKPFQVKGFPRTLPEGWKASPEKIAEALEFGIELGPNQTYVDPFMKNNAA